MALGEAVIFHGKLNGTGNGTWRGGIGSPSIGAPTLIDLLIPFSFMRTD